MTKIEAFLSREIGLRADSIGQTAIRAAVNARMVACRREREDEYVAHLEHSPQERIALIEEIVVSETWFFREEAVFQSLHGLALRTLRNYPPERPFRVLSVPCATGEEPYSAAITLLEAGVSPHRFEILACEVSGRALAAARRAVYGKNSFRSSAARGSVYFDLLPDGIRVNDAARSSVTFVQGNVLDRKLAGRAGLFDVILCRNLLIYFDQDARRRALDNLFYWLADDGVLVTGSAEAVESMDRRFQPLPDFSRFAYRKRPPADLPKALSKRPLRRSTSPARVQIPRLPATQTKKRVAQPAQTPRLAQTAEARAGASLEAATELANRGLLQQAALLCQRTIAETGASAAAYCLLGIVQKAAGDARTAIDCFNKALYLKPDHYDALVYLALLHEEKGEPAISLQFRRRAERALLSGSAKSGSEPR